MMENTRIAVVIVKNLKDRVRTIEGDFYTGREKDEILNSMIQTFHSIDDNTSVPPMHTRRRWRMLGGSDRKKKNTMQISEA
ncbi:hypothetical protein L5515_002526 [Caenorhabditis briggsae]|uniref:Uncharacterized protein n=1 Tax=Caenorhabditis briggsae TaxID=6238 RepID=A0AAE9J560_CAEBR|nr:hypothetical protein L5515_002526 [Caenorhabditis briggsae]